MHMPDSQDRGLNTLSSFSNLKCRCIPNDNNQHICFLQAPAKKSKPPPEEVVSKSDEDEDESPKMTNVNILLYVFIQIAW
jgi:hypothetical protein